MDSESMFWVTVWKIVATSVVLLVAIAGGCTTTERILISKAIEAGVDPIEARCAIVGVRRNQADAAICAIVANKEKQ